MVFGGPAWLGESLGQSLGQSLGIGGLEPALPLRSTLRAGPESPPPGDGILPDDEYARSSDPVLRIGRAERVLRDAVPEGPSLDAAVAGGLTIEDGEQQTIPVFLQNGGAVDSVQFSIDYDVTHLAFVTAIGRGGWEFDVGGRLQVDRRDGRIQGRLRHSGGARAPPEAFGERLVDLLFVVRLDAVPLSGHRLEIPARFTPFRPGSLTQDPREETFLAGVDVDPDANDASPRLPAHHVAGGLTVYYRDAIELGGGRLTDRPQTFVVPLRLTRLSDLGTISVGVDYDELIMRLAGVRPRGSASTTQDLRIAPRAEGGGADFDLTLDGSEPVLLRAHVADLVFELLEPAADADGAGAQQTRLEPSVGAGEGADGAGASEVDRVAAVIEFVEPWFLRGNVDASVDDPLGLAAAVTRDPLGGLDAVAARAEPTLADAIVILEWLYLAGDTRLACRAAADVNRDGRVLLDDPIELLGYLFGSLEPPASPFPLPGPIGEHDDAGLGCERSLPLFLPQGD